MCHACPLSPHARRLERALDAFRAEAQAADREAIRLRASSGKAAARPHFERRYALEQVISGMKRELRIIRDDLWPATLLIRRERIYADLAFELGERVASAAASENWGSHDGRVAAIVLRNDPVG